VGIDAEWHVMLGREEFYNVTKLMHNALQGNPQGLTPEQWQVFAKYNELNALELSEGWDVIIIHDPQPAAILQHVPEKGKRWIWRCHIDLSTPNPAVIERMVPLVHAYDGAVFHLPDYVPDGLDVDRPLMCQVSRFDPWKDPMGVIDASRLVKEEIPEVQLALIGSMATDDPEGWDFFNQTMAHADGDPDVHILNNLNSVGAIEVNAFQSQADVVIQKSTREGFGLTVSEALWKARPFIGGDVGGIPLQVKDGETGYLVSSPEECAKRSTAILREPDLGRRLGRAGKEHVRKNFLTPRLLRDWLRIFKENA